MRHKQIQRLFFLAAIAIIWCLPATPASGSNPSPVLTQHNDNGRTGAYLGESLLTTTNVNSAQFGKLFVREVDGQIYAQPLYVPGVAVPGGPRNVVYVATMHNSVYAFDADNPAASQPLWQVSLGLSAPVTYTIPNTTTLGHDFGPPGYDDIVGEIGILSTPVIDPASKTLYVVALTREPKPPVCPCQYAYQLHALDLANGSEKFAGPVTISGSVPGTAAEGENGVVSFQVRQQDQRTALLLQDGVIYMGFASFGSSQPYHGWVFGYDAATLQQVSAWNSTPDSGLGGIWQTGQGLAANADGKIYVMTANGHFNPATGDYGDSFVKLDPQGVISGVLPVIDSFTPENQSELEAHDQDLGSGGALLLPGTQLMLGGGKSGLLYLLDQSDMGGYQEGPGGTDRLVASIQATDFFTIAHSNHPPPVFWNGPTGPRFYIWGEGQALREFGLTINSPVSATIQPAPVATSTTQLQSFFKQGAALSLSANGSMTNTGILWAVTPFNVPGTDLLAVLRAYNASNVTQELWDSSLNLARDAPGKFAKFNAPTVANGKVYVATFSNQLVVYGLMRAPWIITQPQSQVVVGGQNVILSTVVSGQAPLSYQWYRGVSGETQNPVGPNAAAFNPAALPGTYWVRVSNVLGHIDSATAVLSFANHLYLPNFANNSAAEAR